MKLYLTLSDVIGVATDVSDVTSINTRRGDTVSKRTLNLLDTTARTIELTLWGKNAEEFNASGNPILAMKAVRVSDFNSELSSAQV